MPLYEYVCQPNGHRFEVRHGMNEDGPAACPECGSPVRRVIHPVGIMFKGSGFYATDSRQSSPTSKPEAGGKKETTGDKPSEKQPSSESSSGSTGDSASKD